MRNIDDALAEINQGFVEMKSAHKEEESEFFALKEMAIDIVVKLLS
jgi:hypothetical protein